MYDRRHFLRHRGPRVRLDDDRVRSAHAGHNSGARFRSIKRKRGALEGTLTADRGCRRTLAYAVKVKIATIAKGQESHGHAPRRPPEDR